MSGIYADFMSNNKVELDPEFARKTKEMNDYYTAILTEVARVESVLESLKIQEKQYNDIVTKTDALRVELQRTTEKKTSIEERIELKVGELNEYECRITQKVKEEEEYNDLSEQILALQIEKQDIISFNEANKVSREDVVHLTKQSDLLKDHIKDLEKKKDTLNKEILLKEHQSRMLDRDLELPEKKLQEAKQLNDSAQSTFKAIEEIKKQDAKQIGTIGWYIAKLQKKYPDLDFLNVV